MKIFIAAAALALALNAGSPLVIHAAETAVAPTISINPVSDRLVLPAPKSGRARPLVAIVAGEGGAETTDFIIPFGVLKESGLADVRTVSPQAGPVQLLRTIRVQPDQTFAEFDAAAPDGADIIIVPAQGRPDSPALLAWIRDQAAKGAVIVSICEGARVLAAADLLQRKRVTTHWGAIDGLEKAHPEATWVRDARYVQDGTLISTTGVAASLPASLALVEAIGGPEAAHSVAGRLGVRDWSTRHRTADFQIGTGDYMRAAGALGAFWRHETVAAPVSAETDEIALALKTDAWGRGLRAKVLISGADTAPIRTRRGLVILPDTRSTGAGRYILSPGDAPAGDQLRMTLDEMTRRYGAPAARLAILGMEIDAKDLQ